MAAKRREWDDLTRQRFADGHRDKAQTFANRKRKRNREACRNFRWKGE